MSIDDAIKEAVDNRMASIAARVEAVSQKLDVILSVIVAQQRDACVALNIDPDTMRAKVLNGEVEILSADGSRLNFVTLKSVAELKPMLRKKRRQKNKS